VKEIRFSLFSRVKVEFKSAVYLIHSNGVISCAYLPFGIFSSYKIIDVSHCKNLSFNLTKVIKSILSH